MAVALTCANSSILMAVVNDFDSKEDSLYMFVPFSFALPCSAHFPETIIPWFVFP